MKKYKKPTLTKFYRITEIIEATMTEEKRAALLKWHQKMAIIYGNADIKKEEILNNGTQLHESIEKYLLKIEEKTPHPWLKHLIPTLSPLIKKEKIIEKRIYNQELKITGKPDLYLPNEKKIIDWTTSQRLKKRKYLEDKFTQCGGYALLLKKQGYPIKEIQISVIHPMGTQNFFEEPLIWTTKFLERYKQFFDNLK